MRIYKIDGGGWYYAEGIEEVGVERMLRRNEFQHDTFLTAAARRAASARRREEKIKNAKSEIWRCGAD